MMRTSGLVIACWLCLAATAWAQESGRVATRWRELASRVEPGSEVVVIDESGRARRGRLVSISADQLVLTRPVSAGAWEAALPLYFPADLVVALQRNIAPAPDRVYSEGTVVRIDRVDSTRNGAVYGALAGVGLVTGVALVDGRQPDGSLKGMLTMIAAFVGLPVSIRLGHVIDRLVNQPVYERQPVTARVTIAPAIAPGGAGVVVRVGWPRR